MTGSEPRGAPSHEDSLGALAAQASQQLGRLVREELRLAQAEMAQKGRRFGVGGGLFGGAGMVAFVAFQAAVAAAIAALALVLPVWASALIVTGALLVLAALLALAGRKQVRQGTPPVPEQAIEGVRDDMATIKEGVHR